MKPRIAQLLGIASIAALSVIGHSMAAPGGFDMPNRRREDYAPDMKGADVGGHRRKRSKARRKEAARKMFKPKRSRGRK
jgi:hypothetical protein